MVGVARAGRQRGRRVELDGQAQAQVEPAQPLLQRRAEAVGIRPFRAGISEISIRQRRREADREVIAAFDPGLQPLRARGEAAQVLVEEDAAKVTVTDSGATSAPARSEFTSRPWGPTRSSSETRIRRERRPPSSRGISNSVPAEPVPRPVVRPLRESKAGIAAGSADATRGPVACSAAGVRSAAASVRSAAAGAGAPAAAEAWTTGAGAARSSRGSSATNTGRRSAGAAAKASSARATGAGEAAGSSSPSARSPVQWAGSGAAFAWTSCRACNRCPRPGPDPHWRCWRRPPSARRARARPRRGPWPRPRP